MTAAGDAELAQAIAEFEKQQARLLAFEQSMRQTTTVVDSPNKMVRVTLDGHGELTDVQFTSQAYRTMAPAELSSIVLTTLQSARAKALQTMSDAFGGPVTAAGTSFTDVGTGLADLGDVLNEIVGPMTAALGVDFPTLPSTTPDPTGAPDAGTTDTDHWRRDA